MHHSSTHFSGLSAPLIAFGFLRLLQAVARPCAIFSYNIVSVDPHSLLEMQYFLTGRYGIISEVGCVRHYILQVEKMPQEGSC